MLRMIIFGFGFGIIMTFCNYLFFVKIFSLKIISKISSLQSFLAIGYLGSMMIFIIEIGRFLTFSTIMEHRHSYSGVFNIIVILIFGGSFYWFFYPALLEIKGIKTNAKERRLSTLFLLICLMGLVLGSTVGLFVLFQIYPGLGSGKTLDQLGIPKIAVWLCMAPFMLMAIPLFSVPLFLLILRPFYSKEAIIRLTLSGRNPNIPPVLLVPMNFIYKVAFFCIDLFYPDKN